MLAQHSQNMPVNLFRRLKFAARFVASLGIGALLCGGLSLTSGAASAAQMAKPEDVKKMEAALPEKAPAEPKQKRKVLVYGNANGFVHSSIPLGEQTIVELGEKTGAYTATISNDPSAFDADSLKDYDAVVLVSTTGHFLLPRTETKGKTDEEKKAIDEKTQADVHAEKQRMQNLVDFVEKDGKGLMGIHAASDAYYDVRAYGELIGGYFNGHPWNEKVGIKVDDPESPLTKMFDKDGIDVADEIYQFTPKGMDKDGNPNQTYSREKLHVLLSLDYTTPGRTAQKGKTPDNDFGVSWIHDAGKGRVFYCSLGHREEIYWNPTVLKFYLAGLQFALGDLPADAKPAAKTAQASETK